MSRTFIYLLQNEYLCRRMMEEENITTRDVCNMHMISFDLRVKIMNIISRNPRTSDVSKAVYNYFHSQVYHTHEDPHFKYQFLKQVVDNVFVTPDMKEEFLRLFCIIQRAYRGFARLAHLYRCKRAPVRVSHDLYLSPLEEDNKHVLCLLIDGHKYLFHLNNMVSFFQNSLTSMEYFISCPVPVKNPYTNSPFSLAVLYTMYFFIQRHVVRVPQLIEAFFSLEFNLLHFSSMYKDVVQDTALTNYVKNADNESLSVATTTMIMDFYEDDAIPIHPSLPRDILVRVFRPYLKLYYKSRYSLSGELNRRYGRRLRVRLARFFYNHPRFGNLISDQNGHRLYNLDHGSFNNMNRTQTMHAYMRNHIASDDMELDQMLSVSAPIASWRSRNGNQRQRRGRDPGRRGQRLTSAIHRTFNFASTESESDESEETDHDIEVIAQQMENANMEMELQDHDTSSSEHNGSEEGDVSQEIGSVRI